jgi:aldehyde:ferredoxin oxidoreductase
MRYAETGFNLEIDLSTGNIEKVETDPRLTVLHLGGQGTAAKILWDRVPPETKPFDPDNLLIFSTGILHGTPVPGANRTNVDTFYPQTDLYSHSMFGGFFGPQLKFAGYDKIVISGKSPSLVYLWINNDKVEIRDATHLQGKGALETGELIKQELKQPDAQVAAIGLAGENRVYMATIEHEGSSASRGVGVVMGDKRLKAIAVRGTKSVNVARPAELFEVCRRQLERIYERRVGGPYITIHGHHGSTGDIFAHNEDEKWHTESFAWGNARTRRKGYWSPEIMERWTKIGAEAEVRWTGCYNCPNDCHRLISYKGRYPYFNKCFTKITYALAAYKELDFNYDILGITHQHYGLDGYSTPQVLAFACELYEAGILTDADLPGFPTDSGERFFYLVEKIVHREGIGDALANGIYWAARQIGRGAEAFDHNSIKKHEQLPLKLKLVNYPFYLMYSTCEKIAITNSEGSYPQAPIADKEERRKWVEGWEAAPERFKQYFMEWEPEQKNPSFEASINIADWNEIMHYVDDAVGMCAFLSCFRGQWGGRQVYHINNYPDFISPATGMDLDSDGLWEIAKRNRTLIRAINIRRGLQRADEKPPEDHWAIREPENEKRLLDEYYKFKGWNNEGIPTKETLDKLGLDYVSEDLIRRGILTDNEDTPSKETPAKKEKN